MEERKENIVRDSTSLTEGVGGCKVMYDNLLNEVANFVVAPVRVLVMFDESFLELPKDILIMYRRWFPLRRYKASFCIPQLQLKEMKARIRASSIPTFQQAIQRLQVCLF
ncbi:Glycine--tRNA ligase protein [Dioscorea alata]|uniref:Glycine--tRNA ligase protein n=1 Tax=Dioscorea alata TaxID=55571 RepID=A0ACB7U692_DIOAL|nr:Glycine--tRNA ligase protein [Dioscorea alata]